MKKLICLFIYTIISFTCYSQIGIHTITPAGMLEVTSGDDKKLGLVLPIVSKLEDVEHVVSGEAVKRGTVIFDEQRNTVCHKTITGWSCLNGDTIIDPIVPSEILSPTYFKASNTREFAEFGKSVAISDDGKTLAVGSIYEFSSSSGINGDQNDDSAYGSGAVYVFTRSGTTWSQQAYIKASNPRGTGYFGNYVALSGDGNTLAVGAYGYSDSVISPTSGGRAYTFTRSGTTWSQQAEIYTVNTKTFGWSVALSIDGNTLAVSSHRESSSSTGINGDQYAPLTKENSGAVYVFTRSGTTWSQQAYIKASNADIGDYFGWSVALSGDGNDLAVGARQEESNATGINGDQSNNSLTNAGAVYVFTRSGTTWSQQAYIKASNTRSGAHYGDSVAFTNDGNMLAVGSTGESSNATGINGNQNDTSLTSAGAVYVYTRSGTTWSQQAYIKAKQGILPSWFGWSVSFSVDGTTLVVGAYADRSYATGINPVDAYDSPARFNIGAVYVYTRSGTTWSQALYLKPISAWNNNFFGQQVALARDAKTLAVGSREDPSNATGINGDPNNNIALDAGAAYIYYIRK